MANNKKKAMIIAMAAITGASVSEECAAARAAKQAMLQEFNDVYPVLEHQVDAFDLCYDWDPSDGDVA